MQTMVQRISASILVKALSKPFQLAPPALEQGAPGTRLGFALFDVPEASDAFQLSVLPAPILPSVPLTVITPAEDTSALALALAAAFLDILSISAAELNNVSKPDTRCAGFQLIFIVSTETGCVVL